MDPLRAPPKLLLCAIWLLCAAPDGCEPPRPDAGDGGAASPSCACPAPVHRQQVGGFIDVTTRDVGPGKWKDIPGLTVDLDAPGRMLTVDVFAHGVALADALPGTKDWTSCSFRFLVDGQAFQETRFPVTVGDPTSAEGSATWVLTGQSQIMPGPHRLQVQFMKAGGGAPPCAVDAGRLVVTTR